MSSRHHISAYSQPVGCIPDGAKICSNAFQQQLRCI